MLMVITHVRPAGDEDEDVVNAFCFQLAKLSRAFIECRQAAILRRVFLIIAVAFGLDVAKATDADLRSSYKLTDAYVARYLFSERNEETCLHRVAPVTLRHVNIVSVLEETEADGAWIAEASKR